MLITNAHTVKLGYNELGYNELPLIVNTFSCFVWLRSVWVMLFPLITNRIPDITNSLKIFNAKPA